MAEAASTADDPSLVDEAVALFAFSVDEAVAEVPSMADEDVAMFASRADKAVTESVSMADNDMAMLASTADEAVWPRPLPRRKRPWPCSYQRLTRLWLRPRP